MSELKMENLCNIIMMAYFRWRNVTFDAITEMMS